MYFEWTIAPSNQVSVHVSESSDEEELEEGEGGDGGGKLTFTSDFMLLVQMAIHFKFHDSMRNEQQQQDTSVYESS